MDYNKALAKQLQKSNGRKIVLISEGVLGVYLTQAFERMGKKLDKYIDMREMCAGGGILFTAGVNVSGNRIFCYSRNIFWS